MEIVIVKKCLIIPINNSWLYWDSNSNTLKLDLNRISALPLITGDPEMGKFSFSLYVHNFRWEGSKSASWGIWGNHDSAWGQA